MHRCDVATKKEARYAVFLPQSRFAIKKIIIGTKAPSIPCERKIGDVDSPKIANRKAK